MPRTLHHLHLLLEATQTLGLPHPDITHAKEYLQHNEPGLCLDTIITQLYEYEIPIDLRVYEQIEAIGRSMGLPVDSRTVLQELLVPPESLPEPIQIRLNDIFK